MDLLVVYEDDNFVAINKPAGLLVHKTTHSKELTLVDFLLERYPEIKKVGDEPNLRPGIVHRLDKDTSGIIIVARKQAFFDYFKNLLQKHEVEKNYLVLVHGKVKPKSGCIKKPIGFKSGTVVRTVYPNKGKFFKEAITYYKVLKYFRYKDLYFSLLNLSPKTGRTHQLRVHLASLGYPVVGDQVYSKRENPWSLKRQFLHAQSLEFSLPNHRRLRIEADLPQELQSIIDNLEEER